MNAKPVLFAVLSILLAPGILPALSAPSSDLDSDHDGLSDALEQRLLVQFSPVFLIANHDCAGAPAQFQAGIDIPTPDAENGSIYGQVTPSHISPDGRPTAEIHYYHLWDHDCGPHGHALDTEHVSALVEAPASSSGDWKALAWYAAAHESTPCDVSQIARASTLHAEDHGAAVWISPGKHASYLGENLCAQGCGADRCESMIALKTTQLINLGEPGHPMNGSTFIAATEWPLLAKMTASNFPPDSLAQLPTDGIAWFNTGPHPAQGVIATSYATGHALAVSGQNTTGALSDADDSTSSAIANSARMTGHALSKSAQSVVHALSLKPYKKKEQ
ncbi:MAG TPA: hypothetical protein VIM62_00860 [Acidobacteriaceae bacterium]